MPFQFSNASSSSFRPGMIYLGVDEWGREIGLETERHAITIAGSGTGKGAAVIIPNLLRWPHNVLCIDPGGGNVKETWQARCAMGQKVLVFDPFKIAPVPPELRASFNPLQGLVPGSDTYAEDVGAIADGLVARHDPKHATWDNRGRDIIEGVIDFVVDTLPPERRTLSEVRRLLILDPEKLGRLVTAMGGAERNAQSRAAAALLASELEKPNGYLNNAQENTKWLDSAPIAAVLQSSQTRLSAIKWEKCSVYLVLPPDKLGLHGRFLRLFVRTALNEMANGGEAGEQCLFVLDEFFSLGKLEIVQQAAGLLRKNGVQLWPFLQDLGQLRYLYGPDGSETFFGNSDIHMFFGNTDALTLEYMSRKLGVFTPAEAGTPPILPGITEWERRDHQNTMARFQHENLTGKPRMTPDQLRAHVAKLPSDPSKVASRMIVFGPADWVFSLRLAPFFRSVPERLPLWPQSTTEKVTVVEFICMAFVFLVILPPVAACLGWFVTLCINEIMSHPLPQYWWSNNTVLYFIGWAAFFGGCAFFYKEVIRRMIPNN